MSIEVEFTKLQQQFLALLLTLDKLVDRIHVLERKVRSLEEIEVSANAKKDREEYDSRKK